ncbi:patatin-like phospholipase family protein [Nocardia sp. NPDC005978]|uniref:patatin-like phospholipase family protein n=1 Tax=unclassified Nocardia TaxID=2637762 RepID=UPI0033AE10F0
MDSRIVDRTSGDSVRRSIVLGGGGAIGGAWMLGLAAELQRGGIDLGAADSVVGTSAGAVVGAALVTGQDPNSVAEGPFPAGSPIPPAPVLNFPLLGLAFSALFDRTPDREEVGRRVGRAAMAEPAALPAHIAPMQWSLGGRDWPDDRLRIAVVDTATGQRQVLDSGSGVPLAVAATASRAFPGSFPPVVVGDRRYIDGGFFSPTNADLAADSDVLLVLEPLAHRYPPEQVRAELANTATGAVVRFGPDAETIAIFDAFTAKPDLITAWPVAFRSGVRQADELAKQLIDAGWAAPGSPAS